MWQNNAHPGRPQMTIWRMHTACWLPKATNTHSVYVILIAFPLQQQVHECAPMLRCTYIAVLSNLKFLLALATLLAPVALKTICSATCVWHEHNFSVVLAKACNNVKSYDAVRKNLKYNPSFVTHADGEIDEFPPKRRHLSSRLHGVISHKTIIQNTLTFRFRYYRLKHYVSAWIGFAPLNGAHSASACLRYVKVEQLN